MVRPVAECSTDLLRIRIDHIIFIAKTQSSKFNLHPLWPFLVGAIGNAEIADGLVWRFISEIRRI